MGIRDVGKRVLLGRKLRNTQLGETLLPKRIALPVFASDALSSVGYAPDEIFLTLSVAGLTYYTVSWKVGIAVALVMLTVVASYRQNVQAYQSGGGDYEVAGTNLGRNASLTVASALMVDYVLTVAVSISSAVQYAATAIQPLQGHQAIIAIAATLFIMTMNLRGIKESGTAFAIPTYIFMVSIIGMAIVGFVRYAMGNLPQSEYANFSLKGSEHFAGGFGSFAVIFLILRAFASGSAALTGVEAISNGVPAFRKPKGKNAASTLLMLGTIAVTMGLSILFLGNLMHVRLADVGNGVQLIRPDGSIAPADFSQDPVIGQLAKGIFDGFPVGFYVVAAATGVILMLAANTAFNGFPVLGSILARDGYLPRQLHTRGDRLAYSNGIVLLAGFAIVLIYSFNAEVTKLIQLYIVGVFVSFTTSQTGMIRHWTRLLRTEKDRSKRRAMFRSRVINAIGLTVTALVLVIVLITKFTHGAWIAICAMVVLFFLMKGIRHHYDRIVNELEAADEDQALPSRIHSLVLVSKLHRPTLRALAYAKAARPSTLEAVTVSVDDDVTEHLLADWDHEGITIPLKVLASPYREITKPVLDYVRALRRRSPRDVVMVYIPEYVVGHWWEQLLHNQSALRLKGRLLFTPGVMVTSVPFQLQSSALAERRLERSTRAPGAIRRGEVRTTRRVIATAPGTAQQPESTPARARRVSEATGGTAVALQPTVTEPTGTVEEVPAHLPGVEADAAAASDAKANKRAARRAARAEGGQEASSGKGRRGRRAADLDGTELESPTPGTAEAPDRGGKRGGSNRRGNRGGKRRSS